MFVQYAIIASRIQYQACSIEYRASRIENRGAHGTIFTTVESPLQIRLFMQNKAKFRKVKLNVNKVLTRDYEKKTLGERGKKQSQTNPNKAKFKKAKMNVNKVLTKDYENMSNWAISENKPNSNPIQTQSKPIKPNFRGKKMLLSTFLLWDVVPRSLCCLRVYLGNVG